MTKYLTAGEEQLLLDAACDGDVKARNSVIMNRYSLVRQIEINALQRMREWFHL